MGEQVGPHEKRDLPISQSNKYLVKPKMVAKKDCESSCPHSQFLWLQHQAIGEAFFMCDLMSFRFELKRFFSIYSNNLHSQFW